MDYKNGKIYRIVCEETGRQYIGSTCSTLVKRLSNHKTNNVCSCKDFINPKIFLIEDYPCDRKDQLLMRERFHMENMECVNLRRPISSYDEQKEQLKEHYYNNKDEKLKYQKEHYYDNIEKINQRIKEYYQINKEKISKRKKEKITCDCGSVVARYTLERHKKSKKHIKLTT